MIKRKPVKHKAKRVISEAHKLAISKKLSGIPRSEEVKQKIRAGNLGKMNSEESKAKQSASNKGREISPEWRQKISNSLKGNKQSAETIKKRTDKTKGQKRSKSQRSNISKGAFEREKRKRDSLN